MCSLHGIIFVCKETKRCKTNDFRNSAGHSAKMLILVFRAYSLPASSGHSIPSCEQTSGTSTIGRQTTTSASILAPARAMSTSERTDEEERTTMYPIAGIGLNVNSHSFAMSTRRKTPNPLLCSKEL